MKKQDNVVSPNDVILEGQDVTNEAQSPQRQMILARNMQPAILSKSGLESNNNNSPKFKGLALNFLIEKNSSEMQFEG